MVIGKGNLIATADHVLGPAKSARIRTLSGEVILAKILLRDPLTDIALLEIEQTLQPIAFTQASSIGTKACAIGNSFGLDISLTCGVISAKHVAGVGFNQIEDFIQTDAPVNPGMSGGALVNKEGEMIGLLSAIFTRQSDANIGVNFAVSTQLLRRVIEGYQDDGQLVHTKSGLFLRPNNPDTTDGLIGLKVVRVESGSPEDRAGIQTGDILLLAGARRLKNTSAYQSSIALQKKGEALKLHIYREGKTMIFEVKF